MSTGDNKSIANRLLKWFDRYGRHDLPWQKNRTPYRVWVSEIMLQQTQVTTVIPYYQRFMRRFPNIKQLAEAHIDEVLHHWTGLGYYARARNLHKTAQIIRDDYSGRFPLDINRVVALPGIGLSTAGAILAQSKDQRHAILDGNVKRVLTRLYMIEGWPDRNDVKEKLWQLAEKLTPHERVRDYTQAIMDLGATLCTRTKPDCGNCPLARQCDAHQQGRANEFPYKKPKRKQPVKSVHMLLIRDPDDAVLLYKRPPAGIWGGLWSLPECAPGDQPEQYCRRQLGLQVKEVETLPVMRHTFSHFHLDITPVILDLEKHDPTNTNSRIMDTDESLWYKQGDEHKLGFATPVKSLLEQL